MKLEQLLTSHLEEVRKFVKALLELEAEFIVVKYPKQTPLENRFIFDSRHVRFSLYPDLDFLPGKCWTLTSTRLITSIAQAAENNFIKKLVFSGPNERLPVNEIIEEIKKYL